MSYYNQQQNCCFQQQQPRQQCCQAQPQQYCAPQQSYSPPPPPPPPPMPCPQQNYAPPPLPPPQQPCPYAAARAQQQQYQQQYQQPQQYNNNAGYGGVETAPFPVDGYSPNPPNQFNPQNLNLPAPNMSCINNPEIGQGQVRFVKHPDQTECKNIDQCFNLCKTVTRDNVVHHQHNKNVIINVNRNHNHLLKVVNRDHNLHHHLINNIIKVNDIHHQRIEQVRGEGRVSNDYKQVQRIEQPSCQRGSVDNLGAGPGPQQSPPTPVPQQFGQPPQGNCQAQY